MGEPRSSASNVKATGLTQGDPVHGADVSSEAFRLLTTGGVVSTSKRSLSFAPVSASPGLCEGESEATTFIW